MEFDRGENCHGRNNAHVDRDTEATGSSGLGCMITINAKLLKPQQGPLSPLSSRLHPPFHEREVNDPGGKSRDGGPSFYALFLTDTIANKMNGCQAGNLAKIRPPVGLLVIRCKPSHLMFHTTTLL